MRKLKSQPQNDFRVEDSYTYIKLPRRNSDEFVEAKVDTVHAKRILSHGRWYLKKTSDCSTDYVIGDSWIGGKNSRILLHRFVIPFVLSDGVCVDHRNGNGLDNTIDNLAIVTVQQNSQKSMGADRDSVSGVRGVRWEPERERWLARVKTNGVTKNLGRFINQFDAECAVNEYWSKTQTYDGTTKNLLRIHSIIQGTEVNGPGNRYALWTQGCAKGCSGCFNTETWAHSNGVWWTPQALAIDALTSGLEGITATGGDPLEQPEALLTFLQALHDENGNLRGFPRGIICFTGYTMDEVLSIPAATACLPYIDLLIDGRYVESLRYTSGLAGSSNQNFNFNERPGRGRALIPEEEIHTDQGVEVFGGEDNTVQITGFPVIDRKWLAKLGLKVIQ